MNKQRILKGLTVIALAFALSTPATAQQWKPVRPVNLIVPWTAGGSTDSARDDHDAQRNRRPQTQSLCLGRT